MNWILSGIGVAWAIAFEKFCIHFNEGKNKIIFFPISMYISYNLMHQISEIICYPFNFFHLEAKEA